MIGVGEDSTVVGREEVKYFGDVLECEFFDDKKQRYRDVSTEKMRSGEEREGGKGVRFCHDEQRANTLPLDKVVHYVSTHVWHSVI